MIFTIGEEQQVPSHATLSQHEETGIEGILENSVHVYTVASYC